MTLNKISAAIAVTEAEQYFENAQRGALEPGFPTDIAAERGARAVGMSEAEVAAFVRSYVATRRLIDSLAPARDPFAEFGGAQ